MIGWLDCHSGVSGDMVLGALVGAGVPLAVLQDAVDDVAPEPVRLRAEETTRAGIAAIRVHVDGTESTTHRTWADVEALLGGRHPRAGAVFARLAHAEARVHGTSPDDVHFHEVGALDAIADIVSACAGLAHLGLDQLVVSPVAVGAGTVRAAHGRLPVPGPAVVEMLTGVPTYAGLSPDEPQVELTTPTGAALIAEHATGWGAQPPMRASGQGLGAGSRDLAGRPNVLRLLIGAPFDVVPSVHSSRDVVLETNVDDLDPRLWPGILMQLLAAGAADAWLTPILMKKGRPAHTLHVLTGGHNVEAVRELVLTETSAIGLRETQVTKTALPREVVEVDVHGRPVRVKVARLDGRVVNAQPEWDDVAAAASVLGRPAKAVLAQAAAAASSLPHWHG